MTAEPEAIKPKKNEEFSIAIIEDLFSLGYAKSENIVVYKDEKKNVEIITQFRTLTPLELREISEILNQFGSFAAQLITEKIETLARSIVHINNMPLVLDIDERDKHEKEYGKGPTQLEMARKIISEKIKSQHIIDMLYEKYRDFTNKIADHFEDVKKKLNNQTSSSSTDSS